LERLPYTRCKDSEKENSVPNKTAERGNLKSYENQTPIGTVRTSIFEAGKRNAKDWLQKEKRRNKSRERCGDQSVRINLRGCITSPGATPADD